MNSIALLDDFDFIKSNIEAVKRIAMEKGVSIIPLTDAVSLLLKKEGIDYVDYHKFEYEGIYDGAYLTAKKWAQEWYKPEGEDLSLMFSVSAGSIMEWSMVYFFSHLLRLYGLLKSIITETSPEKIILMTRSHVDILRDSSLLQKVDIMLFHGLVNKCCEVANTSSKIILENLKYPEKKIELGHFLWNRIFYYFNLPLSITVSLFDKISGKTKKIVFFEGFHHLCNIMVNPHLKRFQRVHLQKKIGPSLLWRIYPKGIKAVALDGWRTDVDMAVVDAEKIKIKLKDFFTYDNENIFACVWPRLIFLLGQYFKDVVAPDIQAFEKILRQLRPDCVVLENDVTYYEKTLVLVSKKIGISTVVIQHGASSCGNPSNNTLVDHTFYPLTADFLFSYGEAFGNWFLGKGLAKDKIINTGGSRFDDYYEDNKSFAREGRKNKTVLVVLQDFWDEASAVTDNIELNIVYDHISRILEVAKQFPDVNFIVRPRDKKNLWEDIFNDKLMYSNNCSFSRKMSLKLLFPEIDLVIGYFSTVLLEALICRIPVISIDVGVTGNLLPLWEYDLAIRLSSFSNLEGEIRKILYDEVKRRELLRNIDKNIRMINCCDDGRASRRIAKEMGRIITKM